VEAFACAKVTTSVQGSKDKRKPSKQSATPYLNHALAVKYRCTIQMHAAALLITGPHLLAAQAFPLISSSLSRSSRSCILWPLACSISVYVANLAFAYIKPSLGAKCDAVHDG
jgi:hypothetical protein